MLTLSTYSSNLTLPPNTRHVLIDHINHRSTHENGNYTSKTDIILEKGAALTYLRLQNIQASNSICNHEILFHLKDSAQLTFTSFSFGALQETISVEAKMEGKNTVSTFDIGYYADENQEFNMRLTEHFLDSDSRGIMRIKGIGDGQSRVKVDGMIQIDQTAHRTQSHLEEHTLLLSGKARVQNIPSLKICTNDVRASHASTTSRIDSEQLFYLISRGVDENTARSMIIQGFLKEMLEPITHQQYKQKIVDALGQKTTTLI